MRAVGGSSTIRPRAPRRSGTSNGSPWRAVSARSAIPAGAPGGVPTTAIVVCHRPIDPAAAGAGMTGWVSSISEPSAVCGEISRPYGSSIAVFSSPTPTLGTSRPTRTAPSSPSAVSGTCVPAGMLTTTRLVPASAARQVGMPPVCSSGNPGTTGPAAGTTSSTTCCGGNTRVISAPARATSSAGGPASTSNSSHRTPSSARSKGRARSTSGLVGGGMGAPAGRSGSAGSRWVSTQLPATGSPIPWSGSFSKNQCVKVPSCRRVTASTCWSARDQASKERMPLLRTFGPLQCVGGCRVQTTSSRVVERAKIMSRSSPNVTSFSWSVTAIGVAAPAVRLSTSSSSNQRAPLNPQCTGTPSERAANTSSRLGSYDAAVGVPKVPVADLVSPRHCPWSFVPCCKPPLIENTSKTPGIRRIAVIFEDPPVTVSGPIQPSGVSCQRRTTPSRRVANTCSTPLSWTTVGSFMHQPGRSTFVGGPSSRRPGAPSHRQSTRPPPFRPIRCRPEPEAPPDETATGSEVNPPSSVSGPKKTPSPSCQ